VSEQPMGEQRVIDLSVEVPGTPEQVWEAVATGPGITSWYVPHQVEEREGGTVRLDFGPGFGEVLARVSAWEPPRRVVFSGEGERALAFEWLVEARDGDTCVVRLVNSGFGPGEDWDADYGGMSSGWRIFLESLRLHRTHFPDQRARAIIPTRLTAGPHDAAFATLCAHLGVPADLRAGQPFATSGAGVPALAGAVQSVQDFAATRTYFLLLDQPAPGTAFLTAEGAGDMAAVSLYLYLYGPDAAALPDEWTPFFAERFPQPEIDEDRKEP
jgi:uncharacterized protein YndB with AHSA1/START domain